MDLRQVRYFVTTAEEGSVTRAAARLRITQPALSRQIHALEDSLGLALIDRAGRGIRLTSAARDLLSSFRDLLQQAGAVRERAAALSGEEKVTLGLIAPSQSIEAFLADALADYLRRFPRAEIEIVEAPAEEVQQLLERNAGQIAIAARPIGPQFRYRTVARGAIHVALPADHALAAREGVEVEALADEPILALNKGTLSREMFDSACNLAQILPRLRHESSSPHALAAMAEAGLGAAVLPVTARVGDDRLRFVKLLSGGQPLTVDLAAVWNPNLFVSPAIETLIEVVGRHMRRAPFLEPISGKASAAS